MNTTHIRHARKRLGAALASLALLVAGLGAVSVATSSSAMADTTGPSSPSTPGAYADTASSPEYTLINFYTTFNQDPGPTANIWTAHEFYSNGNSDSGYVGMDTATNSSGAREWAFTLWGSDTSCIPSSGAGLQGACTTGGKNWDGDTGATATIWYPWKAGVKYTLTVRQAGSTMPGYWVAKLHDPSNGNKAFVIGYIKFAAGTSDDTISPYSDFVEYYNWNDPNATCGQQLPSSVTFSPITGNNAGVVVPTVDYSKAYGSTTCAYADNYTIQPDGSALLITTP